MKQLLFLTVTMVFMLSCKAQTFPLYNPPNNFDVNNAYYKDIDGDLTKLVGTWEYTNGNEIFTLILKKQTQFTIQSIAKNITYTKDVLYGEYKYINSVGLEINNTLTNVNSFSDISNNLVYGSYIKGKNDFPVCNSCTESERRLEVLIDDPLRTYFIYEMEIRHVPGEDLLGVTEHIKIKIKRSDMAFVPQGQPSGNRLPLNQEFILNKQ